MRPLRLILVCVLLGAVTTVGVAWGICVLGNPWKGQWAFVIFTTDNDIEWYGRVAKNAISFTYGYRPPHAYRKTDDRPPAWTTLSRWYDEGSQHPPEYRGEIRAGWPVAAGAGMYREPVIDRLGVTRFAPPAGWSVQKTSLRFEGARSYVLPLRPLPLGFTVDTVFYGAIWFGLIVSPGFVRRRLRQRRGQCPSCGYDMRGSDGVCSECGA